MWIAVHQVEQICEEKQKPKTFYGCFGFSLAIK